MKKYAGVLTSCLIFISCSNSTESKRADDSTEQQKLVESTTTTDSKTVLKNTVAGIYYINIYSKNHTGGFHMDVLNPHTGGYQNAAPRMPPDYKEMNDAPPYEVVFPEKTEKAQLMPRMTVLRGGNGTGDPIPPGWKIVFDITCRAPDDSVDRPVTPRYEIAAKNYYDSLRWDGRGNDGFRIFLNKNFTAADVPTMLNTNRTIYEDFKRKTHRQ